MAVGFPTKVTYADGDVYSASDVNDSNGTLNLINPSAKGDLFVGSAANTYTKLSVGANDTVLTADSSTATGTKWATPSAGKILQVIFATDNTVTSNSTTTYADTSLSATITPANSSNKVLVLVATVVEKNSGNQNNAVKYRLMRGATQIQEMQYLAYTFTAITNVEGLSMTYLDSPATTSATTYKTQIANQAAFAAVNDNPGGSTATTMVLMEVAP
jgi:hypothetical protein